MPNETYLGATSRPIVSKAATLVGGEDVCLIENVSHRLRFAGPSAAIVEGFVHAATGRATMAEIAEALGCSVHELIAHAATLLDDHLVLDLDSHRNAYPDPEVYNAVVRYEGAFWNQEIFREETARAIFSGRADAEEVRLWGREFYFFVRSAKEYMARGVAAFDGLIEEIEPILDHFVDEAPHDEIFAEGLLGIGFAEHELVTMRPLATTQALINHLYDRAGAGPFEYAALFVPMQPEAKRPDPSEIAERYDRLRNSYPSCAKLFDAFEKHDMIDAELEHSSLAFEELVRLLGVPDMATRRRVAATLRETADAFKIFYRGVRRGASSGEGFVHVAAPNALGAFLASDTLH